MTDREIIPEELKQYINEEVKRSGYELVDIVTRGGRGFFLEIIIDKEGGITADECGAFNRETMSWIDEQGLFEGGYTIDVCSPGLDRLLRSDNDFIWAVGKQVEMNMHEPVEGKSTVVGKLLDVNNEEASVEIEDKDGTPISITRSNIARAKLWVSIGERS